jgi:hypothetical protein
MGRYKREPKLKDFINWLEQSPSDSKEFYEDCVLPLILDLESEDYFGTEGFDRRFG